MNEDMSDLPQAETADPDGVQVALRAAHTLWSRGDTTESLKWLRKAAESASDEGADVRSLQLAKAAAELRARLFRPSESRPVPPVTGAGAGEISGAHPIARPFGDSEGLRAAASMSSSPLPQEGYAGGGLAHHSSGAAQASGSVSSYPPAASSDEHVQGAAQPVVTATQYPSHRPRQRMGLSSAPPPGSGSARDGATYAAVPSWSAESERRISSAPPPLPQQSIDDYEELEAEPDEETADDPGSVWSSGTDSWRPAEPAAQAAAQQGSLPPPLPPRGAFAEDESDFVHPPDPPTVVVPTVEEGETEGRGRAAIERRAASAFNIQGNAWDQQTLPSWDPNAGSSWAAELRNGTWGSTGNAASENESSNRDIGNRDAIERESAGMGSSPGGSSVASLSLEPGHFEPALQSDTAPSRLTARVHHQAVRVSFAPDLRVPGQYVVRALREGEKAATGERIALLVALEPGMPLV
jgi:hypothetical protein